jgi:hypothetical protein
MIIGRWLRETTTALALALLLGGAATQPAAAEDQHPIERNVAALTQDCLDQGGTPSTDWDVDANGNAQVVVSCDGLGDQSWHACTVDAGYGCDGEQPEGLTRPPTGYGQPGASASGGTTMIFNGG